MGLDVLITTGDEEINNCNFSWRICELIIARSLSERKAKGLRDRTLEVNTYYGKLSYRGITRSNKQDMKGLDSMEYICAEMEYTMTNIMIVNL